MPRLKFEAGNSECLIVLSVVIFLMLTQLFLNVLSVLNVQFFLIGIWRRTNLYVTFQGLSIEMKFCIHVSYPALHHIVFPFYLPDR
jgi:hypothetical protein